VAPAWCARRRSHTHHAGIVEQPVGEVGPAVDIRPLDLTDTDVKDLVQFLDSLTSPVIVDKVPSQDR
jgi:hypothetical protein